VHCVRDQKEETTADRHSKTAELVSMLRHIKAGRNLDGKEKHEGKHYPPRDDAPGLWLVDFVFDESAQANISFTFFTPRTSVSTSSLVLYKLNDARAVAGMPNLFMSGMQQ